MDNLVDIDPTALANHFGRAPMAVRHHLTQHPLLTVEAIAELAEELPVDRVEHNYADLPKVAAGVAMQRSSDPPGEVARTIETNNSWMVLKNIELVTSASRSCSTDASTRWRRSSRTARAACASARGSSSSRLPAR